MNDPESKTLKHQHRIKEVTLNPPTSKYPIFLKLFVNDKECNKLPEIKPNEPLCWKNIPPCEVLPESRISLAVYERHWSTRKPRVGTAAYAVSGVNTQSEAIIECDTRIFTVTVSFSAPSLNEDTAGKALLLAKETTRQKRLLEKLGPTRNAIKTIVDIGIVVAELHHAAKATLAIFDLAWSKLEAQERCDTNVETLVGGLASILPDVATVQQAAKLPGLQNTVSALLSLIENASWFIVEYKQGGGAVNNMRFLFSSSAQDQVDDLLKKLDNLKEEFDRRINIQLLQTAELNAQLASLGELKPVGQARYDDLRACLPGTRETLIGEVLDWCLRSDNPETLLWIHGHAGLGKSAIATSLSKALDEKQQLAANFFCKRDDQERRSPQRVLSTIVHGLATRHPPYGASVASVIRQDTSLCNSPIQMQFDRLVRDTLQSSILSPPKDTLIIIVDALDECGDEGTRRQLLGYIRKMSQFVAWLKIVVTSRPDKDIELFFHENMSTCFSDKDVRTYDASNDIHTFIHHRLTTSRKAKTLPEDATKLLSDAAEGLFIWAQTACEFILGSHTPRARLDAILKGAKSVHSTSKLDELYTTAITASIKDGAGDDSDTVRSCLGLIVACSSRTPLSVDTLCKLLGEIMEQESMQSVVDSLGSVLYADHNQDNAVRVYHPSFADYLISPDRSGIFCVDLDRQNSALAERCLRTMMAGLRFNICELETSYKRNQDVDDLEIRIMRAISEHLAYSCLFWISHIVTTDWKIHHDALESFMIGLEMLYWIEVMSLLGMLDSGLSDVRNLRHWYKRITLHKRIIDLERFLQTFYDPISQSTPHLYLSGLGFLPEHATMKDLIKRNFPNTVAIDRGMEERWSYWLRCISVKGQVNCICLSSDGHRIISGSSYGTVQVWDAEAGVKIGYPFKGHSNEVTSVAISPDGLRIVSGSFDKTIRIWDARTGETIGNPLTGHFNPVTSVAFSPDGRRIISGSGDKTVRVWDANTAAVIGNPLSGHSGYVKSVAFSPDGRRIISGSLDKTVRVWNADTGSAIGDPLSGHSDLVTSVAFSPDGRRIISGSFDNTVRMWDGDTGAAIGDPLTGHSSGVASVAFSLDSSRIISGSWDMTVRLWDVETGATVGNPLTGHTHYVMAVAFSPDGHHLVSGSHDTTVRVWDADICTAAEITVTGHLENIRSVVHSPDGRRIISGSGDKTVRLWDADTGDAIGDPLTGHLGHVTSVALSPDGHCITSGSWDKAIRIWNANTGASVGDPLTGHLDYVTSVAFSPDGQRILSGSYDRTLRLWDVDAGTTIGEPFSGHSGYVTSVAFSPDGHRIISGSHDKTVRVWNADTGAAIGNPLTGHSGYVTSVAFSPDGCRIVSGSYHCGELVYLP